MWISFLGLTCDEKLNFVTGHKTKKKVKLFWKFTMSEFLFEDLSYRTVTRLIIKVGGGGGGGGGGGKDVMEMFQSATLFPGLFPFEYFGGRKKDPA